MRGDVAVPELPVLLGTSPLSVLCPIPCCGFSRDIPTLNPPCLSLLWALWGHPNSHPSVPFPAVGSPGTFQPSILCPVLCCGFSGDISTLNPLSHSLLESLWGTPTLTPLSHPLLWVLEGHPNLQSSLPSPAVGPPGTSQPLPLCPIPHCGLSGDIPTPTSLSHSLLWALWGHPNPQSSVPFPVVGSPETSQLSPLCPIAC